MASRSNHSGSRRKVSMAFRPKAIALHRAVTPSRRYNTPVRRYNPHYVTKRAPTQAYRYNHRQGCYYSCVQHNLVMKCGGQSYNMYKRC